MRLEVIFPARKAEVIVNEPVFSSRFLIFERIKKFFLFKFILILGCLLYCFAGFSQLPAVQQQAHRYFFTHLTTASGLASYQVNMTVQDDDGFVWVATNDGLQRYDGVRYKTFRHKDGDSTTLASNLIWQVMIDKEKNLWLLTLDGKVGIFNRKTFQFREAMIRLKDEAFFFSNAPYKKLVTDEFGDIFLIVPGSEVATYKKSTNTFDFANNLPGFSKNLKIRNFTQQPGSHKYWLSTDSLGVVVYDAVSSQVSYHGNNPSKDQAIEELKGNTRPGFIYFDKRGRLWLINSYRDTPTVSCYDMINRKMVVEGFHFDKKAIGYHEIRGFFEQKDGAIWIVGQRIFAKFHETQKEFEQVYNGYEGEHGIDYITITGLMEDREQSVWASTANNGIFIFNPSMEFFTNIKYTSHTTGQPGSSAPVSFMPDNDSTILMGIREDGFYRLDKNFRQVPLHIQGVPDKNNTVIWDMCASGSGKFIWMAAENGVYKYDQTKRSATFYSPALLQRKTVKRVMEDRYGNLWLGTQEAGLFKWNKSKAGKNLDDGFSKFAAIPSVRVNRIIVDDKGYLWVAVNAAGLFRIDPSNDSVILHLGVHNEAPLKLPEQSVYSVLEYTDSLIVIGDYNRLMLYNKISKQMKTLGAPLSGFIASIEKDDDGHLWVSTTAGLYRVTVSSRVFLLLNRNDGLDNDYFMLGSSFALADKRMIFGVYGSAALFTPSAVNTTPLVPDLQITGFTVKDKSLRVDSLLQQKVIVLGPEENSMTIDLSVLSYNSGYVLKYRLEGLDKTWKVVDHNYQLVYSYLPPNKYTLYVETVDADGKTGERTLKLAIRITPPFWRTWWFYSMLLLLLGLIVFRLDFLRTKRREAMQKMRSNIAGNLHREVNTALNNINILSEMAKLKADTNPEKSKEFIGQINIKSETMIIAMDDMLWSIDPGNDSMLKMVERIKEFIESLNTRYSAGIKMVVDKNVEHLKLPMQLRHDALLIFKESIHTQVQCGARDIKLHITYEKSHLVYSTTFDAESCNMQQLNNILYSKDMDKRLGVMNAKLNVDNNKSKVLVVLRLHV